MASKAANPGLGPDTPDKPSGLRVYAREQCHLCEDMIAALRELQAQRPFNLDVIDVDGDDNLRSRYGVRVPVLVAGDGEEICQYHLDRDALDAYLVKIS
jgi:Glutaredoxin-like domain (DUF836)